MAASQENLSKGNSDIIKVYEELCTSYRAIDDFRAKLLGFLPLASAGGAFLLLNDVFTKANQSQFAFAKQFLRPLGLFGFAVTLGLFFYEIYGIRKCHALIEAGRQIECLLEITHGQFRQRPRNVLYLINEPFAAGVIYPIVMAAWLFLALVFPQPQTDQAPAIEAALAVAIRVFVIGFAITLIYNLVLPYEQKIHDFLTRKKTDKPDECK